MTPDKMAVAMPCTGTTVCLRTPLASRAEALASVRALLPRIQQRAVRTESDRRVPHETIQGLGRAGSRRRNLPDAISGCGAVLAFRCACRDGARRAQRAHFSMAPLLAAFETRQLAEQSATFARLGEAAADIDSAYALVMEDACQLESAEADSLTDLDRLRFMRDWDYAALVCRRAATRLFEAGGGTGIYRTSKLQRVWRDVNSAAQHFAFNWDSAMTGYGRTLLDLPEPGDSTKGR